MTAKQKPADARLKAACGTTAMKLRGMAVRLLTDQWPWWRKPWKGMVRL